MENEEDFSERVKKTFGKLLHSLEPSRISDPLWSLTDGAVGKRDQDFTFCRDSKSCSFSSFDDFISHARENSRKYLDNYTREFDNGNDGGGGGGGGGLDSILDFEEEEDTYDKVAVGRENAGDQYNTSDVTGNQNPHFGCQDDLSNTLGCKKRDTHADHNAARTRLSEDFVEASAQEQLYKGGQVSRAEVYSSATEQDNDKVKSILKRKEPKSTSRQSKRVKFDPVCTNESRFK